MVWKLLVALPETHPPCLPRAEMLASVTEDIE